MPDQGIQYYPVPEEYLVSQEQTIVQSEPLAPSSQLPQSSQPVESKPKPKAPQWVPKGQRPTEESLSNGAHGS